MFKDKGTQRQVTLRNRTIYSCRELCHWYKILCLAFIGLFMEVDLGFKKLEDRKGMKSVPVGNLEYFNGIASLVDKINEKISRCICCIIDKIKSQNEYIEMIMKCIDYLYLLGHLPFCTIEVTTILRWDIQEIILK